MTKNAMALAAAALALGPVAAAAAEPAAPGAQPTAPWSVEAFAGRTAELLSLGDPGWRVVLRASAPIRGRDAVAVNLRWEWSEIDVERDPPGWKRAKGLDPARNGLPAQIVFRGGSAWLRTRALPAGRLGEATRAAPDVADGRTGGTEQRLVTPVRCVAVQGTPAKKGSAPRSEVCSAEGGGFAAVKGAFFSAPRLVYAVKTQIRPE